MRLGLALRTLFRILGDKAFARQIKELDQTQPSKAMPKAAVRSEALTLLSTLQREGRFVDFMMESLEGYSDSQIGAAVRDVHRDCGATIKRLFALEPLSSIPEGQPIEVPAGFDPAAFHLTGQVTNQPPFKGRVRHHGWKAAQCKLPEWTGREESILMVGPVEVEL